MNSFRVASACVGIALCMGCATGPVDAACSLGQSGIDTQIGLFRYAATADDFDRFRHVIAARFHQMGYEFNKAGDPDISGLQLSNPLSAPADSSTKVLAGYADANPQFLSLWNGSIEGPGDPKVAFSRIYLGRFKGVLGVPEVTLSLPVTMRDVSSTIDSHSMVTYYALAMNARRASCPTSVVKAFLDKARASYQDLAGRHYIDGDIEKVGKAILALEKNKGQ